MRKLAVITIMLLAVTIGVAACGGTSEAERNAAAVRRLNSETEKLRKTQAREVEAHLRVEELRERLRRIRARRANLKRLSGPSRASVVCSSPSASYKMDCEDAYHECGREAQKTVRAYYNKEGPSLDVIAERRGNEYPGATEAASAGCYRAFADEYRRLYG